MKTYYKATPMKLHGVSDDWEFTYVTEYDLIQFIQQQYTEDYTLQNHLISDTSAVFMFTENGTQHERIVRTAIETLTVPDGWKLVLDFPDLQ